ncbi:MAG: carboxypeptidase-like regulatory domain-containing protein, partial [bacterium]
IKSIPADEPESNSEYVKKLRAQLEEQNNMINTLRVKEKPPVIVENVERAIPNVAKLDDSTNEFKELATKVANIIEGVVKDSEGKLVPNATLIIKDSKLHPVRAMRSTNLGKFVTTTALQNGDYTLEVSKGDLKFDSVDFSLDGKESKAMEIYAN